MRQLAWVLVTIFALCLFTAMAVAQSPGGTTGVNENQPNPGSSSANTPSSTTSSAPVTGSQADKNTMNPSGTTTSAASSTNGSSEKTLEGCILKEKTDYYIQPRTGGRERLTGSQDFSSQVGHQVRVQGTESENQSASNSSASSAGTTGSMASSTERTPTSGPGSTETQNNAAGSIAGNSGSSNATGTGNSASANNYWSGKDFTVTKIDTVSESCPSDIKKKVDQNNGSASH
jgi:hypothetical protein